MGRTMCFRPGGGVLCVSVCVCVCLCVCVRAWCQCVCLDKAWESGIQELPNCFFLHFGVKANNWLLPVCLSVRSSIRLSDCLIVCLPVSRFACPTTCLC